MENLSQEARKMRNQYQRVWRRKNPDKMRQYQANYWQKKADNYSLDLKIQDLNIEGLSQRQIAKELNISVGKVNKIMNAK